MASRGAVRSYSNIMLSHKLLMASNETESGYSLSTFDKGWSGEGYFMAYTGSSYTFNFRYGQYGWLKSDGTQLWVAAESRSYPYSDYLYKLAMSTADDVSTLSQTSAYTIDSTIFSNGYNGAVAWKPDGSKLFFAMSVYNTTDKVYQWPVSSAFNPSSSGFNPSLGTVSSYNLESDTGSGEYGDTSSSGFRDPEGLFFKPDGTKMFVNDRAEDAIFEYSLSTAWDVTTASYNNKVSTTSVDNQMNHATWKHDGTRFYTCDSSDIHEWSLTTAWDVSTASHLQTHSGVRVGHYLGGLLFNANGTKLISLGYGSPTAFTGYNLSTAWDLSTISWQGPTSGKYKALTEVGNAFKFVFGNSGTRIYVCDTTDDSIHEYHLSTAYDISTASHDHELDVSSQTTLPTGVDFKSDGTKMFVADAVADEILEYDLSTAWDISTASYSTNYDINNSTDGLPSYLAEGYLAAFKFKPDGTAFFISGLSEDRYIMKFTLSTAWDITTASYNSNLYVRGLANFEKTTDFAFNPAGTRMILTTGYDEAIMETALSTPWSITSASFVRAFTTDDYMYYMNGGQFNGDGTKFIALNTSVDYLLEFDLE